MTEINLDDMSLSELRALNKKVTRAIETFNDREKQKALAALEAQAKEFGFSLAELTGGRKTRKASGVAKYCDPNDPTRTWTGKGRRPDWVHAALESGKSLDDLKI